MSLTPSDLASGSTPLGTVEYNNHLAATRTGVFFEHSLGGSDSIGHPGAAYTAIMLSKPFKIPSGVELSGTWRMLSFLRCEDPSVTITIKLKDLTAGVDVASSTSSACSGTASDYSGTNQVQLSPALTLVAGHIYVAQAVKSATTKQCFADAAYLQRTDS